MDNDSLPLNHGSQHTWTNFRVRFLIRPDSEWWQWVMRSNARIFRMWTTSASTAPRRECCPSLSSTARKSQIATWSSRLFPRSLTRWLVLCFNIFYEICSRTGNASRADSGSEERAARYGGHGWEPSSLVRSLLFLQLSNFYFAIWIWQPVWPGPLGFLCWMKYNKPVLWLRQMCYWLFNP